MRAADAINDLYNVAMTKLVIDKMYVDDVFKACSLQHDKTSELILKIPDPVERNNHIHDYNSTIDLINKTMFDEQYINKMSEKFFLKLHDERRNLDNDPQVKNLTNINTRNYLENTFDIVNTVLVPEVLDIVDQQCDGMDVKRTMALVRAVEEQLNRPTILNQVFDCAYLDPDIPSTSTRYPQV